MSMCKAALNIKGEGFICDQEAPHTGWAHANKEAGAQWCSDSEARRYGKAEVGKKLKAERAEKLKNPASKSDSVADVSDWDHYVEDTHG